MDKVDQRDKHSTNKCKDCKWSQRIDKYRLVCCHPIWKEVNEFGCSAPTGLSTIACKKFER